jgi:hypothetical protein
MHMRHRAIAVLLGTTLCASAYGHDPRGALPEHLLGGIVQERDVDLVFGYLRDALSAAIQGREAAPPDELVRRAESMGEELKRRGAAAARGVIDAIEQTVREGLRDAPRSVPPTLPPSSAYQRI